MATLLLLFALIKSDFPLAVPLITSLRLLPLELESVRVISPESESEMLMFSDSWLPSEAIVEKVLPSALADKSERLM